MISVKNLKKIINQFDDNWMVSIFEDDYHYYHLRIQEIHSYCNFDFVIERDHIEGVDDLLVSVNEFFGRDEEEKGLKLIKKEKD